MSRYRAFVVHLLVSAMLGGLLAAVVFFIWFPGPYYRAMGGSDLTLLIIAIDLIVGPLMTLVIFKSGKPGLKIDLTIIALIQGAAFLYGAWIVSAARPVFLIIRPDFAIVVTEAEVNKPSLSKSRYPMYSRIPWFGMVEAAAALPETQEEINTMQSHNFDTGLDLENLPEFYRPFPEVADKIFAHAKPISAAIDAKPSIRPEVEAWIRARKLDPADLRFVYLRTRYNEFLYMLDARTRQPLGVLPADVSL